MSTNITELIEWLETKCDVKLESWQQTVLLEYFVVKRREVVEIAKAFTIVSREQAEAGLRNGANPSTCRHNVVQPYTRKYVVDATNPDVRCISCGTYITPEMWYEKNYRYNHVFNSYEHKLGVRRNDYPGGTERLEVVEDEHGVYGRRVERPQARASTDI